MSKLKICDDFEEELFFDQKSLIDQKVLSVKKRHQKFYGSKVYVGSTQNRIFVLKTFEN